MVECEIHMSLNLKMMPFCHRPHDSGKANFVLLFARAWQVVEAAVQEVGLGGIQTVAGWEAAQRKTSGEAQARLGMEAEIGMGDGGWSVSTHPET